MRSETSTPGVKKYFNLRTISQIIVVTIILWLALAHQWWGIEKAAPVDAYCPFGALENLIKIATSGEFLQRIYFSNYILLFIFVVMTIIFGRVFCGFFCPLGAIQEWLRKLGKFLGIKREYELPVKIDKAMRYFKYVVLFGLIVLSYTYGELIFRYYDPFVALSHLWEEFDEIYWAYGILGTIVILSLFTKNWWCRYFCPLGGFFGIMRKFSFFRLEKNPDSCTKCGACSRSCPVGLSFKDMKAVNGAECISCLKCVDACDFSALKAKIAGKDVSKKVFKNIVVFGFFGILLILIFLPFWQTGPVSNIKSADGTLNIENLKWSNTLEYLIRESGVPFEYFQERLHLPENVDKWGKLKHIGEDYEIKNGSGEYIETEDFRSAVEEYMGSHK